MDQDSEIIIMEVEKFPCIYDIRHKVYKNKELKRDCWIGVSTAVVGEEKTNTAQSATTAFIFNEICLISYRTGPRHMKDCKQACVARLERGFKHVKNCLCGIREKDVGNAA